MSDVATETVDQFGASGLPATRVGPRDGVVLKTEPHACFGCGELNLSGLQLRLHLNKRGAWTELSLPERFQGWEGVAHGGIISTILDEVMAWSIIERDGWAVTARMAVEFKNPLPTGRPIRAEGRVVEDRRRIITTAARIVDLDSGLAIATAEATFVAVSEAKKAELQARYGNLAAARRDAESSARPGPSNIATDTAL
jgi:uncharacterized protein (TIGR00369 family)